MIAGPQAYFQTISMRPDTSTASLRAIIEQTVAEMASTGGVLVLVDILGGNPADASTQLAQRGIPIVCGVNLPMLLELLIQREHLSQRELTAIAVQAGRQSIINLTEQLNR
jgi:mannose/fructose-specific phosphotransferase system component IIA